MARSPLPFRARPTPDGPPLFCAECGTVILRAIEGKLRIEQRHHGEKHTSWVTLGELRALLDAAAPGTLDTPAE